MTLAERRVHAHPLEACDEMRPSGRSEEAAPHGVLDPGGHLHMRGQHRPANLARHETTHLPRHFDLEMPFYVAFVAIEFVYLLRDHGLSSTQ